MSAVEKSSSTPPTQQNELSYEQREAEIERADGEVLLMVDADVEKSGAHYNQYKLASDGKTILVPQPSDDPNDPLNWPSWKKNMLLVMVAFGGWNADFASGVGIPALGLQAVEWGLTPTRVNDSGNLGVLMLGIGGVFWIPVIHYWGRAPVFFYTQIIGTFMTLGCAVTPSFAGYYAFRGLQTFFLTSGQTMGLTVIKDMFFFHQLARKIGLYVLIFYASPYLGPQLAGFMINDLHAWRPVFWMSFAWGAMLIILTVLFYDETYYVRENPHPRPPYSQTRRLLDLVGYYGIVEPRRPIGASYGRLAAVIIKPVVIPVMIFFCMTFMWAIGINVTTSILIGSPVEVGGYGFSLRSTSYLYFTPIIALILGEAFGHWFNDFVANRYIKKHHGVFVPEVRLWPNYLAVAFMIPGLVLAGQALQFKWSYGVIVIGWGMYVFGVMICSVCTTAYILDCYPNAAGEVMGFMNLARVMGGFSVGYYQQQWGANQGFNVSFGLQAVVVAASLFIVVLLQIFGKKVRHKAGPVKLGW